jgi:hypothetical protein
VGPLLTPSPRQFRPPHPARAAREPKPIRHETRHLGQPETGTPVPPRKSFDCRDPVALSNLKRARPYPRDELRLQGPRHGRRETLRDNLARELEEHADEVVAAYLAGIRSDDPHRAYRAADAWISRVHGRPKETVENVTLPDDPLDIASMTREERDRLKRKLVAANPEAARELGLTIAS